MKHVSKFDGCVYEISESVDIELMKQGKGYRDDITLIWKDPSCGFEEAAKHGIAQRELVGWYWGEYDYKIIERYIKEYYKEKLNKEN